MTATVDSTTLTAALAAADAAANGAKNAAYLNSIATSIGANYKVLLKRDGTTVYTGTATGSLAVADGTITVSGSHGSVSISTADIDTGSWVIRVEKAAASTTYFESSLTKNGGSGPFFLSDDLDGSGTLTWGDITFSSPALDTEASSGDSVQTVIDDMSLENDGYALYVDSYPHQSRYLWNADPAATDVIPGFVAFGNRWRIDEQLDWVTNNSSIPAQYKTYPGSQCRYVDHWYVLCDEAGHSASNTRVRIEAMSFKLRNRDTKVWTTVQARDATSNFYADKNQIQSTGGAPNNRYDGDVTEVLVPAGPWNYTIHGGVFTKDYVEIESYDCVLLTFKASLVLDNPLGTDDRANARVLIWCGSDVFPTNRGWADLNNQVLPSFAHSRLRRVTTAGVYIHACNLSVARQNYVGPNASVTVESFRQYPPAL